MRKYYRHCHKKENSMKRKMLIQMFIEKCLFFMAMLSKMVELTVNALLSRRKPPYSNLRSFEVYQKRYKRNKNCYGKRRQLKQRESFGVS